MSKEVIEKKWRRHSDVHRGENGHLKDFEGACCKGR